MIYPSHGVNIYVATKPADFRKGHNGLVALVQTGNGIREKRVQQHHCETTSTLCVVGITSVLFVHQT